MIDHNTTVIEAMAELKRQERVEAYNSLEKSKLSTGFLTGQLLKELQDKVLGISRRKMALYSTHDATITSLLYNLGVSNHLLPPYTSTILIELHKMDDQHFIKILYRNSSREAFPLQLPSCTALCPWRDFVRFAAPRSFQTREEFEAACENRRNTRKNYLEERTPTKSFNPELIAAAGYFFLLMAVMYFYTTLPSKSLFWLKANVLEP
ncbi:unnamed protein product [Strongylus vulgaris]|uniref:Uncharacterized protein n=1 Tax=Strongylus vulgaris TaxID=40348 RepID=A0A3P7KKF5_STRVU|nr:unnamed protein product [Strongylus vulgaris]